MAKVKNQIKTFEEARTYARRLNCKSRYDWVLHCHVKGALPANVPPNPHEIYEEEWKSWKDFLGLRQKVQFVPFEEARAFVRKLGLKGLKEWKAYCNWDPTDVGLKPPNIPSSPHIYYAETGWLGYGDFLGTDNTSFSSKVFRSFDSARKFARSLGLTSSAQWVEYCKGNLKGLTAKPDDIPSNIAREYQGYGFQGMNDFLNTAFHREQKRLAAHRRFEEARDFVHSLKLKNLVEWNQYIKGQLKGKKKLPKDVPTNPALVYKNQGWAGYGDWLGTFNVPPFMMEFKSYEEARAFARKLGLVSSTQWIDYCKGKMPHLPPKPDDIPHSVARSYNGKGWVDYQDFLMDDETRANYSKFLPYEQAKAYVNNLGLKNVAEWHKYLKGKVKGLDPKPDNIPTNPAVIYKDQGWVGMGEWLDNGAFPYASKDYRSFKEARSFVRDLGLRSSQEWVAYCKGEIPNLPPKPIDIPANIVQQYTGKGWKGYKDFLATKRNRDWAKKAMPFQEARKQVRTLRLKSEAHWRSYSSGKLRGKVGVRPVEIPSRPDVVYLREGWKGWEDWLGL